VGLQHLPRELEERARRVLERADLLGAVSEEPGRLVRRYATEAMRGANALVAQWMEEAGLEVRTDAAGNLLGRSGGEGPALLLGSHLDTVVDAGRYDGPLGVLVALEVVATRTAPLEVVAFADEEGVRFGTSFLGSSALAGRLDPEVLDRTDRDGVRLADALRAFGGDPDALPTAARAPGELRGYVEVHIEQGPVLEQRELPVGVVTAIAGQSHGEVAFGGKAGHAGTVPMAQRHDALAAAAELVLAVEAVARERGVVATVGTLHVAPGARNVIPARAALQLDVRAAEDHARLATVEAIEARARAVAARRGVGLDWTVREASPAVALQTDALAAAVEAAGLPLALLPSGAGHDAAMLAALTPAAMLFVRCREGISHHPGESVERADVAAVIAVLDRLLSAPPAAAAPAP